MKKREKEIFEILRKDLADLGNKLTPSTILDLKRLANAHYVAEGLEKEVEEKGSTQYTKNGYGQTASWFSNLIKMNALIIRYETSLGLFKADQKEPEKPKDINSLLNP